MPDGQFCDTWDFFFWKTHLDASNGVLFKSIWWSKIIIFIESFHNKWRNKRSKSSFHQTFSAISFRDLFLGFLRAVLNWLCLRFSIESSLNPTVISARPYLRHYSNRGSPWPAEQLVCWFFFPTEQFVLKIEELISVRRVSNSKLIFPEDASGIGVAVIITAVSGPDQWLFIHDQDKNIDRIRS